MADSSEYFEYPFCPRTGQNLFSVFRFIPFPSADPVFTKDKDSALEWPRVIKQPMPMTLPYSKLATVKHILLGGKEEHLCFDVAQTNLYS